jgi:hypothetical protein
MTMRGLAALAMLSALGCGSGDFCPQATVKATCATARLETCRDKHGNACIECAGGGVQNNCIYDPNAPLDGGTAVCVDQCKECGADCLEMK